MNNIVPLEAQIVWQFETITSISRNVYVVEIFSGYSYNHNLLFFFWIHPNGNVRVIFSITDQYIMFILFNKSEDKQKRNIRKFN